MNNRTLICDLNVYDNGHHIAFVNSILTYTAGREDLLFLFNGKAADFCKGMVGDSRIFLVPEEELIPDTECNLLDKVREYRKIQWFAKERGVGRVIFLEIDCYQVAIGLSRAPFRISGIYFRPFHLIPIHTDNWKRSLKSFLYRWKKRLLFLIMRMNRQVEPLFLLNDRQAAIRYPTWFRYLPDPVFDSRPASFTLPLSIRRTFGIPPSAHIILAFGAMGARKNITNIVAAYRQARFGGDTALLIAGKVRTDYRQEFDAAVNSFAVNTDTHKRLIVYDEFVDEEQIDLYFREAGTILLCYSKFFGSSGLMGKAAQYGKTCIVPHVGLLAELNHEYGLGYAVDPENVQSIADALSRSEQHPPPACEFERFVNDHNEDAFLRTLLPDEGIVSTFKTVSYEQQVSQSSPDHPGHSGPGRH